MERKFIRDAYGRPVAVKLEAGRTRPVTVRDVGRDDRARLADITGLSPALIARQSALDVETEIGLAWRDIIETVGS